MAEDLKAQAQNLASIRRARSTSARKRRPKDKAVPIRPDSPHLSNLSSELSRFVIPPIPDDLDLAAAPQNVGGGKRLAHSSSQARVAAGHSLLVPGEGLAQSERQALEAECRVQQLSCRQLQRQVEELESACATLREELRQESQLRLSLEERHQAERDALETSLRNAQDQGLKEQNQVLHATNSANREKDHALQALSIAVVQMQQLALELHNALQEQVASHRALAVAARGLIKDLQPLEDALHSQEKKLKELHSQLSRATTALRKERAETRRLDASQQAELEAMKEMLQRWKKETEARRSHAERVSREASVHQRLRVRRADRETEERARDQISILKDLARVLRGVQASLVEPNGRLQKCRLCVEFDAWPGLLVWMDQRERIGSCQLASINLLACGYASKAWALSKEAVENSFSVHTESSTFDFVCAGDAEFYAIVPVLSRLCAHVQGWPVAGSVSSRSELVRWHGWCRVQESFRKRKAGNFCTYLLEKLGRPSRQEKASSLAGAQEEVPSPLSQARFRSLGRLTARN